MALSGAPILVVALGVAALVLPSVVACSRGGDGGAGAGSANQGGGGAGGGAGAGTGGGGATGTYCGQNYAEPPLYCGETETCFQCQGDWGGPFYACRTTPTPAADQFACFFGTCTTANQYCTLNPSPWCGGDFTQGCEAIPASCAANPDCACLEALPCVSSCSVSPDGGLIVELSFGCA